MAPPQYRRGDGLVDAAAGAHALGLGDPHVIHVWRRRGHIQVAGYRGRSPLYRLTDLYRVHEETQARDTRRHQRRLDGPST